MIEVEEITRKFSRIYRSPDDINNFKIRVILHDLKENTEEKKTFRWQEKKYSRFECEYYSDSKHCVTDLERKYHEDVKNIVECTDVTFSYVKEDQFVPENEFDPSWMQKFEKLFVSHLEDEEETSTTYNYEESLRKAMKQPFDFEEYETMYIMADFGEYYENTWMKKEYILCTIKYNFKKGTITVYPDFTNIEPYVVKINTDTSKRIEFWLENASLDGASPDELEKEIELLNQVAKYEKKLRNEKIEGTFELPPKNKLQVFVFLEILTAKYFENSDIYVQYYIDLPKYFTCKDSNSLRGVTASSHGQKDEKNYASFGFPFEIILEFNLQEIRNGCLQSPFIYFEVVSKDTWSRFRTEGFCYRKIPVGFPGLHQWKMHCIRFSPNNLSANLRRFFIGDCGNCEDLTWLAIPRTNSVNVINKLNVETLGTGELEVRMNIVHQSHAFIGSKERSREKMLLEKLNDSSLVKSVEQVLEAFKAARSKMIEARKKI